MLDERQDAYGRAMLDHLDGRGGEEIVERDDGFLYTGAGPEVYLAPYPRWAIHERRCMRWVRGKVRLEQGAAGRYSAWSSRTLVKGDARRRSRERSNA